MTKIKARSQKNMFKIDYREINWLHSKKSEEESKQKNPLGFKAKEKKYH